LSGSAEQFITLAQEFEVIRIYTELEHLRFSEKFTYQIDVDEDINLEEILVPAMLLQPHVENAIRHGLIPSDKVDSKLILSIQRRDDCVYCRIIDNGIGRSESRTRKQQLGSTHRSMGNEILSERINLIRSLNLSQITESINDILDSDGKIVGTSVEIKICNQSHE
jgi:LytS/YehU family sensor histidine kinase